MEDSEGDGKPMIDLHPAATITICTVAVGILGFLWFEVIVGLLCASLAGIIGFANFMTRPFEKWMKFMPRIVQEVVIGWFYLFFLCALVFGIWGVISGAGLGWIAENTFTWPTAVISAYVSIRIIDGIKYLFGSK